MTYCPWRDWCVRGFALPLLVAAMIPFGCGRTPDSASSENTLRVAMASFSDGTFLPWNGSSPRKLYLDAIYEYLVYVDPLTLELQPGLAESWAVSADGYTVTLELREDVTFQRGWGPVSAADVEYTFERVMEPTSVVGISSTLRYLIDQVEAIDADTVRFRLSLPDIDFVRGFLSNSSNVPIVSSRYLQAVGDEAANRDPVGTGPYELADYREDTLIEMRVAGPAGSHWRVSPEFDTIRFLSVPEEFTRAAMLRAHEIDIAPINYDSIEPLSAEGVRIMYIEGNWAPVLRFGGLSRQYPDPDVPWQDVDVRRAMNLAVDKEAIVEYILHGQAVIAPGDFPVREWLDIEPYRYDPDEARKLLAAAGYPDGFDVTLRTFATTPGAELPVIASAIATYWTEAGIRTTIVPTTWTSLRTAWYSGNARDLVWTHRGLAFASTVEGLIAGLHSDNVFATFTRDFSDELIERIGRETDREERSRLIRELGVYLRDQASSVFIGFANEPVGLSDRVGNWPTLSTQHSNIDRVTRARQANPGGTSDRSARRAGNN
jgi:peptide/nickel transport system substrate-binding protein